MKNTFKLFGLMLLASATMFVACDPEEEGTTPGGNDTTPGVTTYTITVNCNDATMGNVAKAPDSAAYHAGTQVVLTATPNSGYKFVNWTGATTATDNPLTITVSENATYTAVFEALPQVSYNATFDGSALDIAGYSDFQTNGEIWLMQFAKQAEGTTVHFPYIVMWMQGNTTSNFSVYPNGSIELYKDTYYQDNQGTQYGDWQYYATNNINCTAMDLTELMLSFTGSFTMYDLGEIVNETQSNAADCTQKNLSVTVSNAVFTVPTKGGFHKMNVK